MADQNAIAAYRRMLARTGQAVTFRRVKGQAPNVTYQDAKVPALFRAYQPTIPIGTAVHSADISEGLRQFIVLDADLVTAGFPVPVQKNDKILVGDPAQPAQVEAYNITEVDYGTRVFAGAVEGKAVGV